jgi:DNA mismatch repair protein MutS2
VFIEPSEIVEINNEIRELEYAERREILRILVDVADDLRPFLDDLLLLYVQLGRIDFLRAKAMVCIRLKGVKPVLSDNKTIHWKNAVHPLLYLAHQKEDKEVVPLDIRMDRKNRILLISGPNAGGKSVCLKTVGLLQYMLQCGIPAPMSENSEFMLFSQIFIDIGDEQSLENDLSTYSGHLLNMKHFLRSADKDTLILIDEFGTGTEPALGGAIAEAILEEFNHKEVFGLITTHYANLKHFASETSGIINGAMLFDTEKIKPLFILSVGEPGSSFAIEIARKIGLPENLLQLASEKVGADYVNFEKHLREIIRDKKYWEDKRQRIRRVERTLDDLYLNYNNELEELQKDRKKILNEAKAEAKLLLKEANRKVEKTIREIKESNADKEKTRTVRKEMEKYRLEFDKEKSAGDKYTAKIEEIRRAGKKLADKSPELERAQVSRTKEKSAEKRNLGIGDLVRMKDLDTVGEVLEISGKNIVVAFGSMITTIDSSKLEPAEHKAKSKKSAARVSSDKLQKKKLNFKPEIDVRGKRADEALAIVQDFIDDAVMVSVKNLKILHGKGNGILHSLIQDYLKTIPFIKSVRDAHIEHGGSGITLVDLDI